MPQQTEKKPKPKTTVAIFPCGRAKVIAMVAADVPTLADLKHSLQACENLADELREKIAAETEA